MDNLFRVNIRIKSTTLTERTKDLLGLLRPPKANDSPLAEEVSPVEINNNLSHDLNHLSRSQFNIG